MDEEDTNRSVLFMFVVGFFAGISILSLTIDLFPNTDSYMVKVLTNECENSLPRDQHCIIKAVPEL